MTFSNRQSRSIRTRIRTLCPDSAICSPSFRRSGHESGHCVRVGATETLRPEYPVMMRIVEKVRATSGGLSLRLGRSFRCKGAIRHTQMLSAVPVRTSNLGAIPNTGMLTNSENFKLSVSLRIDASSSKFELVRRVGSGRQRKPSYFSEVTG
jgi:hypothetical protein